MQESIEKQYFEEVSPNQFVDVQNINKQWRLARVIERDRRVLTVTFDGHNFRNEQFFVPSARVAPLRMHTEGYTGSIYKPFRETIPTPEQLSVHLQIMNKFLNWEPLSPVAITQYLRGELFVIFHTIITSDLSDLSTKSLQLLQSAVCNFISFLSALCNRLHSKKQQFFDIPWTRLAYLTHSTAAIFTSLNELTLLLNLVLKVQTPSYITLYKNKNIDFNTIKKVFLQQGSEIRNLFLINDGTGRWLPSRTRKNIFRLLKHFSDPIFQIEYHSKDFAEIMSIYPYMIQCSVQHQRKYVNWLLTFLKVNSSFDAKLKAVAQLKRMLDLQFPLSQFNIKTLPDLIISQNLVDHLINLVNFNGEILRRFINLLAYFPQKQIIGERHITALAKLAASRHESDLAAIHEIICSIALFASVQIVDLTFLYVLSLDINHVQTLQLLKKFTLNAVSNLQKQNGILNTITSFFRRRKFNSSQGHYGLKVVYQALLDEGRLLASGLPAAFAVLHDFFTHELLHAQRFYYLDLCIKAFQNHQSFGQHLKLFIQILLTYPLSSIVSDDQTKILQKLDKKHSLIILMIRCFKSSSFVKVDMATSKKYFFQFLFLFGQFLLKPFSIEHVQYFWRQTDRTALLQFLRKNTQKQQISLPCRKYAKRISLFLVQDIFKKIVMKQDYTQINIGYQQFLLLDELFIYFHSRYGRLNISQKGSVRLMQSSLPLSFSNFYFLFVRKFAETPQFEAITRRTIQVFFRLQDHTAIAIRSKLWLDTFLKLLMDLSYSPKNCLLAITWFFQITQGKMTKQIEVFDIDIQIQNDNKVKMLTLPRNLTIFALRKKIMTSFNIKGNFVFQFSNQSRIITFQQEEDFSLSALPSKGKHVSLALKKKTQQKHPHFCAEEQFKKHIQANPAIYKTLFSLNLSIKDKNLFWTTIARLPMDKTMVKEIKNCDKYSKEQWQKVLHHQSQEQFRYKLIILSDLLKSPQWTNCFVETQGSDVLMSKLIATFSELQKIGAQDFGTMSDLLRVYVAIPKSFLPIHAAIIRLLNCWSNENNSQCISYSEECFFVLKNMFLLMNNCLKANKSAELLNVETLFNLMSKLLFKKRSVHSSVFVQDTFPNYVLTNYINFETKKNMAINLIAYLNFAQLKKSQSCELFIGFLIDLLNSFIAQEIQIIFVETSLRNNSSQLIKNVLEGKEEDLSKQNYSPLLFSILRLAYFLLSYSKSIDINELFSLLLNKMLLEGSVRRVKHQKTAKALYDLLKKIIFTKEQLNEQLTKAFSVKLAVGEWRKNTMAAWMIEAEREDRALYCGLQNLGATCYINCLFQQLFMLVRFREPFLRLDSREYRPIAENEIWQFQLLLAQMKYSKKKSLSTRNFCSAFRTIEGGPINPMMQSDADQFFNALIDRIDCFLGQIDARHVLTDIFGGQLGNQLKGQGECSHTSLKQQPFTTLGLNIRDKTTLEQALSSYVEGELLDGDNAYFCQQCDAKVSTLKRNFLATAPRILSIVLKRFQFNYDLMRRTKINHCLRFSEQIDLQPYSGSSEKMPYRLRGVVVHAGTADAGHYYSFIREKIQWLLFNDEKIQNVSFQQVQNDAFGVETIDSQSSTFEKNKNAYILLYEREDSLPLPSLQINSFYQHLQKQIQIANQNSNFASIVFDNAFVRLCQNMSALPSFTSKQFVILYFHTIVLRDKAKEEYLLSFMRLIFTLIRNVEVSEWYLKQINANFLKQFCIEAPRMVRYVIVGLLQIAIRLTNQIPPTFATALLYSLSFKGMTPFAKLFKQNRLIQQCNNLQYPKRVLSILTKTVNHTLVPIVYENTQSYFGKDCSLKQKQGQICYSSLCESLRQYSSEVPLHIAMNLLENHSSRNGSKALAFVAASYTLTGDLEERLKWFTKRIWDPEFKIQNLQKFLFFVRQVCLSSQDQESKIKLCLLSLKDCLDFLFEYFDAMSIFVRELHKIAFKVKPFKSMWRSFLRKHPSISRKIQIWLKEIQKPSLFVRKQTIKNEKLSAQEIQKIRRQKRAVQEKCIQWMTNDDISLDQYGSDFDDQTCKTPICLRNQSVSIIEHFGPLKRARYDKKDVWAILAKNDFDIFSFF